MASTTTSSAVPHSLSTDDKQRLRRSGWLLIASFAGFVLFVATLIVTGNGYDDALSEVAKQRGVGLNDLPAEAIAPVNHEYNEIWSGILPLCVIMVALGVYVAGVRLATTLREAGALGRVAVAAAAVMPVCWIVVFALEYSIGIDHPGRWLKVYDTLYDPAIALSTVAGSLALIGVIVVLRRAAVARRTGVVVAVLTVPVLVAAVAFGAPPVVPLLLAAIVGIVMVRTARSAVTA
ncbi:hypothetical protein [Kribbella sp. NPDC051620]|uniref:hypothetical protein n=1 Tax=Kribbella sp. NPDC051620 TaxID=3364120 RepID=UPI0037B1A52C